jgi:23S rRNA (guanosine2251-2'-O)-methyltransferase
MAEDLIYGFHPVQAALRANPKQLEGVWLAEARDDRRLQEIEAAARAAGLPCHRVSRDELADMAGSPRHQGVVARRRAGEAGRGEPDFGEFVKRLPHGVLLLILDGIQDPHNLGACLRSAEAAGAHGVVVPRDHTAPLSAVALKSASGAAESLPLYRVPNLARAIEALKEQGVWVFGATHDADQTLYEADLTVPLALVLGGEGKGLRRLTRESCDALVSIPMAGAVSSLNVSVAAGICLFEAVRQRLK